MELTFTKHPFLQPPTDEEIVLLAENDPKLLEALYEAHEGRIQAAEEDLVDKVRDRLENDPDMEVSFRDLKELSIAKANAFRETMTTRGEATSISEERKVITQEDYEDTLKAARERLEAMKQVDDAEIIEESDD